MTQKEKDLLLKDLCARLPYGVMVQIKSYKDEQKPWFGKLSCKDLDCYIHDVAYTSIKPYLRPMSSMTDEEIEEFATFASYSQHRFFVGDDYYWYNSYEEEDWLNAHHFDYRGLIGKVLAIEVTADNNPYKD